MKPQYKCYRCDADAVTKEHVPPDSFFPKEYRDHLVTVPSCHDHNTKNSTDVEYVRNVIVGHISTNEVARNHFQTKVIRSYQNSPKLFARTFHDVKPIIINGQETGVFSYDRQRFKAIMEGIAYGVYWKMFGKSCSRSWEIFSSSLSSSDTLYEGLPDGWEDVRQMFNQVDYTRVRTPQPDVFQCEVKVWSEDEIVYRFLFYGGFYVEALTRTPHSDERLADAS